MINGIYMIELDKWGITNGIPAKTDKFNTRPAWSPLAYEIAKKNIDGINAAMKYAKDSGTNYVKLPTGEYAITYPFPIILLSGITLDLNNSTLKVLFDSDIYSPYYDLAEKPYGDRPYHITGQSIKIEAVENAHIINGKIIGDRIERSFTDVQGNLFDKKENSCEFTTGIYVDSGAKNCSIRNIDISGFMGDNIAVGSYPKRDEITNFDGTFYKGALVKDYSINMGNEISKENNFRTNYVDIGKLNIITVRCGIGYDRIPDIRRQKFTFFFYNQNKVCLGYNEKSYYLMNVIVPPGTKYVRMLIEDEFDRNNLSKFSIKIMISSPQARDITISDCRIYDAHRGGVYGSGDNLIIEKNVIFNNGTGEMLNRDVVQFPDTTRYQINCEDSFGQNIVIRNNYIHTGFNSVLLGVLNAEVYGNTIWNLLGITVYNNESTNIHDNILLDLYSVLQFTSASKNVYRRVEFNNNRVINCSSYESGKQDKTAVIIANNTFTGCNLSFYDFNIEGNTFLDTTVSINRCQFSSNLIKSSEFTSKYHNNIIGNKFERSDCTSIESDIYKACQFNEGTVGDDLNTSDITMEGCEVNYGTTIISKGYGTVTELGYRFFNNCTFNINGSVFMVDNKTITQQGRYSFEGCTFKLRDEDKIQNLESIFRSSNNTDNTIKYIKIRNSKFIAPNEEKTLNIGNNILQNNSVTIENSEFINVNRQILDSKITYKNCEDNIGIGKPSRIMTNKIVIEPAQTLITINESIQLKATIYPSTAITKLKWTSSNSSVASVDDTGKVFAKSPGYSEIRVESPNEKKEVFNLNVQNPVLPTEIILSTPTETFSAGEIKRLIVKYIPENTSTMYKEIIWSSDNSAIAEVDQTGVIKAKLAGKAIITAKVKNNGIIAQCKVFVSLTTVVKVTGILLSSKIINMKVGETAKIIGYVQPTTATFNNIEWSIDNGGLAQILPGANGECVIKAKNVGQTTIKAVTEEGRFQEICSLNIVSNIESNPPIQPGLIMWFNSMDGSAKSTVWYDRTSNKNDLSLVGFDFDNITNGWINGGLKLKSGSRVECKKSLKVKTIEICGLLDDKVNTTGEIAFFTALPETVDSTRFSFRSSDKYNRAIRIGKIYRYYNLPAYGSSDVPKYGEFFYGVFEIQDGAELFASGIEFGKGPSGSASKHVLFSIRIYDRILTEDERQYNLNYDKKRLGIN